MIPTHEAHRLLKFYFAVGYAELRNLWYPGESAGFTNGAAGGSGEYTEEDYRIADAAMRYLNKYHHSYYISLRDSYTGRQKFISEGAMNRFRKQVDADYQGSNN